MKLFGFIFICILLISIIAILSAALHAYIITFYMPKRKEDEPYKLPQGEQYENELSNIKKWVEELLAMPCEEIRIKSHDGLKLYGRYYHTADGAPVQIMFHGYRSSSNLDFCGGARFAMRMGHNVLLVDQRSHGKSEGHTTCFGILERHDCLNWVKYISNRFGADTKIILSGLSMGAVTVLMSATLDLPENVVGIIADCPFSSPRDVIKKVCRDQNLPADFLFPFIKLGALFYGHFRLEACSAVEGASVSKKPILLFHGDDDRFVPCQMSVKVKEANPEMIHFEIVPGAGHGLCYLVGPKQYETATERFLEKVLN